MRRQLLTTFSLAVATAAAALAGPPAPASAASGDTAPAPASSAPAGALSLSGAPVDVTTSTGRHVTLRLRAQHGNVELDVVRQRDRWSEDHDWQFAVLPGIRFHRDAGDGWVRASASDLHHYGLVDVTLRQTRDWTDQTCTSGSAAHTRVRIKGVLALKTRSGGAHPWGSIGTLKHPIAFVTHARLTADHRCNPGAGSFRQPCPDGFAWAQRNVLGETFTVGGNEFNELDAFRFKMLKHTQGDGIRIDQVGLTPPKPTMTRTDTGVTLDVPGRSAGRLTGSATITGDDSDAQTAAGQSCGTHGRTVTLTQWPHAVLTNGAQPLTVTPDLGHPFSTHDGRAQLTRISLDS